MSADERYRASIIAVAVLSLAVLHFAAATHTAPRHAVHLVLGVLTLLPVLAGAVWFGLAGGASAAVGASAIYAAHVRLSWPGPSGDPADHFAMIGVYLLVGVAGGVLVTIRRRGCARGGQIEDDAERDRVIAGLTELSEALGCRDDHVARHAGNVARVAGELARRRGMPPARVDLLRAAALVHNLAAPGARDVGPCDRTGPRPRTAGAAQTRPGATADFLAGIRSTAGVATILRAFDDRLGSGEVRRRHARDHRAGADPVEADVLRVADTFCALTDPGPHGARLMGAVEAMRIIDPMAGVEVDGVTVALLAGLVDEAAGDAEAVHALARRVPPSDGCEGATAVEPVATRVTFGE